MNDVKPFCIQQNIHHIHESCVSLSWLRAPPDSPSWRALNNIHRVMIVHKTLLLWWHLSSSVANVHTASLATVLLCSVRTWVLVTRTGENSKGRTVLESATGCRWRIKRWTVVSDVGVLASLMCRVCVKAVWMKAGQSRNKFCFVLCAQIGYDDDDHRIQY